MSAIDKTSLGLGSKLSPEGVSASFPTVEIASTVLATHDVIGDVSAVLRNFFVGPGSAIMGLSTIWLAVSGFFEWRSATRELEAAVPSAPAEIAASLVDPSGVQRLHLRRALAFTMILAGLSFIGVRAMQVASFFVQALASAAAAISTVGGGLVSGVAFLIVALSLHKLASIYKLHSKDVSQLRTLDREYVEGFVGQAGLDALDKGDLSAVRAALRHAALREVPTLVVFLVVIASFAVGLMAVAPVIPLVLGIVSSVLMLLLEGHRLYTSCNREQQDGTHDRRAMLAHILLGVVSTAASLVVTGLFFTGVVPLVLAVVIAVVWIGMNTAAYLYKRHQRRLLELKDQKLGITDKP